MGEYEVVEEEGVLEEPLLIEQKYWMVRESDKIEALVRLIDSSSDFYGLVFTQTKNDADTVSKLLDEKGYEAAALHGDIPQGQREKVLARFRAKKTRILVATDVAARGIDISGLSHVVNYSLPFDASTYVHRIGRTGRAGSTGMAFTFVTPSEKRKLKFLKAGIAKASKGDLIADKIPEVEEVLESKRKRLFAQLENSVKDDKNAEEYFVTMAKELIDSSEVDSTEVLSKVLSVMYGTTLNASHYNKIKPVADDNGESKRGMRDVKLKPNQTRLYVQLGKRDGFNAKKISEFFSSLLHIPNHQVDKIDVSLNFTLLNLPKDAAKKVMDISKKDKTFPHVHLDSKTEDNSLGGRGSLSRSSGSRDSRSSRSSSSRSSGVKSSRSSDLKRGDERKRDGERKRDNERSRGDERKKGGRKSERTSSKSSSKSSSKNNKADLYKKKKK